jgi:LysM repeat protein
MSSLFARCIGVVIVASVLLFPAGVLAAPDGSGETVHIVQWGETLSMIAEQYGVTVEAIMAANGLDDPDYVYVGQKLTIPMPYGSGSSGMGPSSPGYAGGTCAHHYTVQWGDTLSGIAWQYGTTANSLMQANNLNSDFIYEGQKLCAPSAGGMSQELSMASGQAASTYYTVRAGDTLAGIALRFGVTQTAIIQANNLSNASLIYADQRLVIPGGYAQAPTMSQPMMGEMTSSPPGYSPMGADSQMAPMEGYPSQTGPGMGMEGYPPQTGPGMGMEGYPPQAGPGTSPAPPPDYSPMGTDPHMGYAEEGHPQQASMGPAPAPPPDYAPPDGTEAGVARPVPMWVGSQIAHSADPDEITTLLVLVEEGNEDLDVMIRSADGFVARGVTGVYYEYSWLPSFAFRGIPGGDYEVWIDGQESKVIKASVDPGWRATVDMHWKIVSPDPVVSPDGWLAEVVDNTSGSEPIGAFSILIVRTGAIGNKIRISAPGEFEAVCVTGTKPEHGVGACDFGGLNAGTYTVNLDGTYATAELYLDGIGSAVVEFRPAGHGYVMRDH